MELLAPVGSKESFITAIRAGANAVYVGVPDFNARISASNISLYDLKVLTDHAHNKGVKVFFALNTLVKHEEINEAVKRLTAINDISPDAIIVQDLGIGSIIKNYFPDIPLHSSTQMAVHNHLGVDLLAKNGYKRVILARELTFSEIKAIVKASPVEIEIFAHGALCFSISGMCLFSSFIGGLSGNRGRCTQPCRRLWENDTKRGYLFSPRDLELAENINKLKKSGVASIKIEGRMRSSEYVYKTVKAYRSLIDASESDFERALIEAKAILSQDAGREKTSCIFSGRDSKIFQPEKPQCLGVNIGKITSRSTSSLSVDTNDGVILKIGDRLRISNPVSDTTIAFKLKDFVQSGSKYEIPFVNADVFEPGNQVFRTIDAENDQKGIEEEIDAIYNSYSRSKTHRRDREIQPFQTYTSLISNKWKESKKTVSQIPVNDHLWVRFDDSSWIQHFKELPAKTRTVFFLSKNNIRFSDNLAGGANENTYIELPPFIGQRDIPLYQDTINSLAAKGMKKWFLNNISQFEFFAGLNCELSAGHFLYSWNAYAAAFLSDLGIKYFTSSWEDDFLNIRKMCGPGLGRQLLVYLFGYVPIVRSRLITQEELNCSSIRESKSVDKEGNSFVPFFETDTMVLVPDKPLCLFKSRDKLKLCGISNFGLDICYLKPDTKLLGNLLNSYKFNENIQGSVKFNFKAGIK